MSSHSEALLSTERNEALSSDQIFEHLLACGKNKANNIKFEESSWPSGHHDRGLSVEQDQLGKLLRTANLLIDQSFYIREHKRAAYPQSNTLDKSNAQTLIKQAQVRAMKEYDKAIELALLGMGDSSKKRCRMNS
eukprot:GHVH01005335.1.p1 GENE.GHVH01005335.1~~GHVH01005335.1.p1  ORF type:complete len:135 (+),score=14.59 GHVH01005335.1:79-483(+)